MHYDLLFDARSAGFQSWSAFLVAAVLIAISYGFSRGKSSGVVRWAALALGVLGAPCAIYLAIADHMELVDALRSGTADTASGVVSDYDPGTERRPASFRVGPKRFCLSPGEGSAGWSPRDHGGIGNGMHVKVWYVYDRIARIEVARPRSSSKH